MRTLGLAVILAVAGCAHDERLSEQPPEATAQVQRWIPVGTSLTDARRIMVQHHFTCSMMTNSSFADLKGSDFLYCERRDFETRVSPSVARRWQVALGVVDDKISAIQVKTGLIGP